MPTPIQKKKEAAIALPIETITREPDEKEEQEYDSLESAAEDLLHALQSKDAKGISIALRAAFEIMDSEPHYEGEHI